MTSVGIRESLLAYLSQIEIIDAHEHLAPEEDRLKLKIDVCNLFGQYTRVDLWAAGMPVPDWERALDKDLPLEFRWVLIRPYLPFIRQGSYARAAWLTAKLIYGYDDINDENYRDISETMQAYNTPGLYHRLLREHCHSRVALTQCQRTQGLGELMLPVMNVRDYQAPTSWRQVEEFAWAQGLPVHNLHDYVSMLEVTLARWKREGAVGLKTHAWDLPEPDRHAAEKAFADLQAEREPCMPELSAYLQDEIFKLAGRLELTVAIHSGVWDDFRVWDVKNMINTVRRRPETRFDIYHAGMPNVRDAAFVGKNFPNVWMNLAWTYVVSTEMTRSFLPEWLDLIPLNKIIGFGGDYKIRAAEKVVGHWAIARETLATVFAERISKGRMTEEEAQFALRRWLWDNPIEAYRLELD